MNGVADVFVLILIVAVIIVSIVIATVSHEVTIYNGNTAYTANLVLDNMKNTFIFDMPPGAYVLDEKIVAVLLYNHGSCNTSSTLGQEYFTWSAEAPFKIFKVERIFSMDSDISFNPHIMSSGFQFR